VAPGAALLQRYLAEAEARGPTHAADAGRGAAAGVRPPPPEVHTTSSSNFYLVSLQRLTKLTTT